MQSDQAAIVTIYDVLDYIDTHCKSAQEKGDMWERVTAWYLRNDPQSQQTMGTVWRWEDSENPKHDGPDTGIDLVCSDRDSKGRYWAVQCKKYDPQHTISLEYVSTFYAKVTPDPAYSGYVIASASDSISSNLSAYALRVRQQTGITTEFLTPTEMATSNVDWSKLLTDRPQNA